MKQQNKTLLLVYATTETWNGSENNILSYSDKELCYFSHHQKDIFSSCRSKKFLQTNSNILTKSEKLINLHMYLLICPTTAVSANISNTILTN